MTRPELLNSLAVLEGYGRQSILENDEDGALDAIVHDLNVLRNQIERSPVAEDLDEADRAPDGTTEFDRNEMACDACDASTRRLAALAEFIKAVPAIDHFVGTELYQARHDAVQAALESIAKIAAH